MESEKKHKGTGGNNNNNIARLSKNMEYILHQEAKSRGMESQLLKSNDFSHIIIKAVQDDERMYLVAMMKRLQQCCPISEEESEKNEV
jgi:hypothetical protein